MPSSHRDRVMRVCRRPDYYVPKDRVFMSTETDRICWSVIDHNNRVVAEGSEVRLGVEVGVGRQVPVDIQPDRIVSRTEYGGVRPLKAVVDDFRHKVANRTGDTE